MACERDRRRGGKAIYVELDTTDYEQWASAVSQVKRELGGLHILMNVVGANDLTVIPDTDPVDWNRIFEINVTATMVGIQTCAPPMRDSGGWSIVNIGSVAGLTGHRAVRTPPPSGRSRACPGTPPTSLPTGGSDRT